MKKKFEIEGLECLCCAVEGASGVAYVLYPMDILESWIEPAARKYGVNIVVVTGMDWDNVFSPWPAPGEPPGSPDFRGESREFLDLLVKKVVPHVESDLGLSSPVRTLFGVSMSGLFALWQWVVCDGFTNIASLSGSFWFPGFIEWFRSHPLPQKKGKAYFLLGDKETTSGVKAFDTVGVNTQEIVDTLRTDGIPVGFESVPGNHFARPIHRLDRAFAGIYGGK